MNSRILTPLDILVLAAAAFTLSRLWFRGGLFAVCREYAKVWSESEYSITQFFGSLLTCPLCLSTNIALWLSLLLLLPRLLLTDPWPDLFQWLLYSLASPAFVPVSWIDPEE